MAPGKSGNRKSCSQYRPERTDNQARETRLVDLSALISQRRLPELATPGRRQIGSRNRNPLTVNTQPVVRLHRAQKLGRGSRRGNCNVTAHPTAVWILQQLREAIPSDHSYRFLLHDRDAIFSAEVDQQLKAFGLRVLRTAARAPKASQSFFRKREPGFAEWRAYFFCAGIVTMVGLPPLAAFRSA